MESKYKQFLLLFKLLWHCTPDYKLNEIAVLAFLYIKTIKFSP